MSARTMSDESAKRKEKKSMTDEVVEVTAAPSSSL